MYTYLAATNFMYACQFMVTAAMVLNPVCLYLMWNYKKNPKYLPAAGVLYCVISTFILTSLILYSQSILLNAIKEDIDYLFLAIESILTIINMGLIVHHYGDTISRALLGEEDEEEDETQKPPQQIKKPVNPTQKSPANLQQKKPANSPQRRLMDSPQRRPKDSPQRRPIDSPQRKPIDSPQRRPMNSPQKNSPLNRLP
ncbi:hypothetical protein RF11_00384 [Thelohanellus kitauei]|nr:hypothetical protein RF11_00384 [Thelohanellus kitauei]